MEAPDRPPQILPRQGEVAPKASEGADARTTVWESSPSVSFAATSPGGGGFATPPPLQNANAR
jgi:hypothetical protein